MARARHPRRTHRSRRTRIAAALAAALLPLTAALTAPAAHADEIPANGNFTFTTGPGILPAWDSAGVSLVGVSPGSVITNKFTNTARVNLPIISKSGTANATAGGFRFVNTETGESFRCSVPVVDTRARVIDCVLPSGYNAAVSRSPRSTSAPRSTPRYQDHDLPGHGTSDHQPRDGQPPQRRTRHQRVLRQCGARQWFADRRARSVGITPELRIRSGGLNEQGRKSHDGASPGDSTA